MQDSTRQYKQQHTIQDRQQDNTNNKIKYKTRQNQPKYKTILYTRLFYTRQNMTKIQTQDIANNNIEYKTKYKTGTRQYKRQDKIQDKTRPYKIQDYSIHKPKYDKSTNTRQDQLNDKTRLHTRQDYAK